MYRFLTYLERVKRIVEYKVSYTDCARDSSNSGDGFSICIKTPHKYKILPGASEKTSSKSFFGKSMDELEKSPTLSKVFRFRYERVNSVVKIQKPYVMLLTGLTLKPGQPTQVG